MSIIIENVSKKFNGNYVLERINLEINTNQVYCLLGRNGAGKSTLINIACDLLDPDDGSIIINGDTYREKGSAIKKYIGLQSQYEILIEELSGFDYLYFMGKVYQMKKTDILNRLKLLTEYFFEDASELRRVIRTYSIGTRRKISICAAFLHSPKIVFLDEPFANIDPVTSNSLCKLITEFKSLGGCVVMSSHDLLYVNMIATHVGIINNHKVVFDGSINALRHEDGLDAGLLKYIKPEKRDDDIITKLVQL